MDPLSIFLDNHFGTIIPGTKKYLLGKNPKLDLLVDRSKNTEFDSYQGHFDFQDVYLPFK